MPPSNGYYNILLLGADSGLGRDSMRFDSISVVSVNADTGAVHITGIPRDLAHVPFSAGPMQDLYPDGLEGHISQTCGWGPGINQLTNAAENCREDKGTGLYPDAAANSSSPAVEAAGRAGAVSAAITSGGASSTISGAAPRASRSRREKPTQPPASRQRPATGTGSGRGRK